MEPPHLIQSSTLPPAQPAYVLRGHAAQVHAVQFLRGNLRLLSGDAGGWVVLWNVPIRRPAAVWRAHQDTILGVGSWGEDKIITHGRDSKLHVWQLVEEDESTFSTIHPLDDGVSERKQPWLLHSLTVNTMNFCSFAMCEAQIEDSTNASNDSSSVLIATPGVQDGSINVTTLPPETRFATIPVSKDVKTGMVMAIGLRYRDDKLLIVAGYESGHAIIWKQNSTKHWDTAYVNKAHSQPVLSLDFGTQPKCFFTSSADAVIARHPLEDGSETKCVQTKHAGQQGLVVRSDQKIFATAGWDGRARVYSAKTMKELAVLKWHKEGSYTNAFAQIYEPLELHDGNDTDDNAIVPSNPTVSQKRIQRSKNTHWLACGSKDGKISLWEVY